jgi:hypothetical protein
MTRVKCVYIYIYLCDAVCARRPSTSTKHVGSAARPPAVTHSGSPTHLLLYCIKSYNIILYYISYWMLHKHLKSYSLSARPPSPTPAASRTYYICYIILYYIILYYIIYLKSYVSSLCPPARREPLRQSHQPIISYYIKSYHIISYHIISYYIY